MFDYVYFLKMVSIAGMSLFGILVCGSLWSWYYYECTKKGNIIKRLMEVQTGRRIIGYSLGKRILIFLTFVLIFISIR